MHRWNTHRAAKHERVAAGRQHTDDKVVNPQRLRDFLHGVIRPGDRVALEGDNQKQADFLSRSLAGCDPAQLHDLHMLISSVSRPEHLDLFERGIAAKLDLAYAGPQSVRIAQMVEDGTVHIGAIHTYVELYARMFVDLAPDVVLLCAERADRDGNLYTGPNTEDTPTIAEAAAFHDGVVIVQADEIVDDSGDLPRVDIPGSWVDYVVAADSPFFLEPLFTRDPRHIGPVEILKAMIAIRGVYERHQVVSLNHGVGFDTAAIELLLPTYGERLGLKGSIARHWVLNPHPTLIPAIESGWVTSIHSFGGEAGMERYTAARPDVFFTGADGSLRSNRVLAQLAGQYAIDMFIGSSLQIDRLADLARAGQRPRCQPPRTQTRRGDRADLPRPRCPHVRGRTRRRRRRSQRRHAVSAGDDLRRRRLPRRHGRGRRLPVQGTLPDRQTRIASRNSGRDTCRSRRATHRVPAPRWPGRIPGGSRRGNAA